MKRGINTGMSLQEIQSNDAPPVSVVGRACLIAIHDTVVGVNVIQASTDIEAIYGAGTLTDRLKHVQLAAGSSMYLVVASFPTAQVIGANIQSLMQTVIDLNHQVEFWVFNFPADSAMMVKIEEALTYFQNNARWYSSVSLSKDSRVLDLEGAVVADNADGTVAIPETAHGFSTDETLIISGSDNYDGSYPVLAASTADVIHITHAYTAETFEAGVVGEEKPSEYADAFGTEFETLSHNKGMLICQTTQEDHFGKIIGE
ncbi:MAG: hypothetical protein HOD85_33950, partial [Deltaproteobacteria bacterium]|nr:hypothetical protein [Deltaproteobacteria bacterium]